MEIKINKLIKLLSDHIFNTSIEYLDESIDLLINELENSSKKINKNKNEKYKTIFSQLTSTNNFSQDLSLRETKFDMEITVSDDEKSFIPKNNIGQSSKSRYCPCKYYVISYDNKVNYNQISAFFYRQFNYHEILEIKKDDQKNVINVSCFFDKEKKFHLKHRALKINNIEPITIKNNKKLDKENLLDQNKSCNEINNKISEKYIFSKFPWIYKRTNTSQMFDFSDNSKKYNFIELKMNFNYDIYYLLNNNENFNSKNFVNNVKTFLDRIDIVFYNEYILSSLVTTAIIEINQDDRLSINNQIQIISVDHKFVEEIEIIKNLEENENNKEDTNKILTNYRCVI